MPQSAPHRRLLPLIGQVGGGRSRQTCRFRCGDACFHEAPNKSDNPYFGDIAAAALSRRNILRAGAVGAGATAVAGLGGMAPAAADGRHGPRHPRLGFESIGSKTNDAVEIPRGYQQHVVIRWGDAVLADAPEFDFENQTAAAQAKQFGYNCDYVGFMPLSRDRGLLWVNHEYTNENLMFAGYTDGNDADLEHIKVAMAAHGGSVVELQRIYEKPGRGEGQGRGKATGGWRMVEGRRPYNRRITTSTPMQLTGPAAGHELLRTEDDPEGSRVLGMLNNCAGGMTPWGTILTCEENFNQYFVGGEDAPEEKKEALARYGIITDEDSRSGNRRFDRAEERFDLSRHPNEANRFGYVIEVDPHDPGSTPAKRTMLGRIKHEGANPRITHDGRVAVYMGDDERFDYIYKFVSKDRYRKGSRRANSRLLDSGTLYVARLRGDSPESEIDGSGELPSDGAFDGWGEWIQLCSDTESFVEGFSVPEVLVHTRLAADAAGATKMDRPEDFEPNPATGKVYCALTNNTAREPGQADEPNPRGPNRHGHILEISERRNDAGATKFRWDVPIVCGDPDDPSTYFAGYDKSKVVPISSPDNVTFDDAGNLWIATDGMPSLDLNDGLFAVPMEGRYKGELKAFATVPVGAECCGPLITKDQKTAFIAPQHPGDGGSVSDPISTWPDRGGFPRPSVVTIWHGRGKDIGR